MILITGVTGFVGDTLFNKIIQDHAPENIVTLARTKFDHGNHIQCDLAKSDDLEQLSNFDIRTVFHCASAIPSRDKAVFFRSNVQGFYNLLRSLNSKQLDSITLVSSVSVYGDSDIYREDIEPAPIEEYGKSKLIQEYFLKLFAKSDIYWRIVRPSSIYGPGNTSRTVLPIFYNNVLAGKNLHLLGPKNYKQNFIHVYDVVSGLLSLSEKRVSGIFNLFGPKTHDLHELAIQIIRVIGREVEVIDETKEDIYPSKIYDGKKITKVTGWKPKINLESGLKTLNDRCHGGL